MKKVKKSAITTARFFIRLVNDTVLRLPKNSLTDGAYYVVGKDIKKNIFIVSQYPYPEPPPDAEGEEKEGDIILESTNWISGIPDKNKTYTAQIRYHGDFLSCKIKTARQDLAEIIFEKPILVASGQSCVIYDSDICLGGGVVV